MPTEMDEVEQVIDVDTSSNRAALKDSARARLEEVRPDPGRRQGPSDVRRPHRGRRRACRDPARRDHRADRPQRRRQDDLLQPAHRLRPARRGRVVVQRHDLKGMPAYRVARRGMVRTFQLTKVLSRLTVIENMRARGDRPAGRAPAARDVRAAVARPGDGHTEQADELLERFLLSQARGLRRRAVRRPAQAARDGAGPDGRPELVMLDEPMAGVNPALKQSLLGHVKSLRDEGRTVLFVEHDMDMVRDISDWVIVMARARSSPRAAGLRHGRPARSSTPTSARTTTRSSATTEERPRRGPGRARERHRPREARGEAPMPTDRTDATERDAHRERPPRGPAARRRRGRRLRARRQHPQRLPT